MFVCLRPKDELNANVNKVPENMNKVYLNQVSLTRIHARATFGHKKSQWDSILSNKGAVWKTYSII